MTTQIKERPILFSTPMVKAILADKKSMTRRTKGLEKINANPDVWRLVGQDPYDLTFWTFQNVTTNEIMQVKCPYGQVGDRLWVRETWKYAESDEYLYQQIPENVVYKANGSCQFVSRPWKPSIFMPRWASRITLEITNIRVERLQEISLEDADREGFSPYDSTGQYGDVLDFRQYWNKLNGKIRNRQFTLDDKSNRHYIKGQIGEYSWEANPWVWCISFKKLEVSNER